MPRRHQGERGQGPVRVVSGGRVPGSDAAEQLQAVPRRLIVRSRSGAPPSPLRPPRHGAGAQAPAGFRPRLRTALSTVAAATVAAALAAAVFSGDSFALAAAARAGADAALAHSAALALALAANGVCIWTI